MADVGALVEDVIGFATPGAVEHRVGVDDEVVVLVFIEGVVGEEHAEPLEPAAAFDVSRDHAKHTRGFLVGVVEERHQRRGGHHRFDAGNQLGLGAILDDLQGYPLHHLIEWRAADAGDQSDEVREHRQKCVDVLAGEQGAAGGGGAAHETLDAELLLRDGGGELFQVLAVVDVRIGEVGVLALET